MSLKYKVTLAALMSGVVIFALEARSMPLYGQDDRKDLFEIEDPRVLELADSTVALFKSQNVKIPLFGKTARLTNLLEHGYARSLCPGERFYHQPEGASCSGALIGPDLVLTAAHCIKNEAHCLDLKIIFGFSLKNADETPAEVPKQEVYSCVKIESFQYSPSELDLAVIRLDRPVLGHRPLRVEKEDVSRGTPLLMIGNPYSLPTKVVGNAWVVDASSGDLFLIQPGRVPR